MRISSNSCKEVLLTFIEWSRLIEQGFLEVGVRRRLPQGASVKKHMQVAPHIGYQEDAYILCKFKPSSKMSEPISLDRTISFNPVTEKGKRLLEVSSLTRLVKLDEPAYEGPQEKEGSWLNYCQSEWENQKAFASHQLVKLFGIYTTTKSNGEPNLSSKDKKIPNELFVFPIDGGQIEDQKSKERFKKTVKTYLGTPACSYSVIKQQLLYSLKGKEVQEEFNQVYKDAFKDFSLATRLDKLRIQPNDGPFFENSFFEEYWSKMEKCQKFFDGIIDIRVLLFFYNYAGLGIDEREIDPSFLAKDVDYLLKNLPVPMKREIKDKQKITSWDQINDSLYHLGTYIPLKEIIYWMCSSKDERSKIQVASDKLENISVAPTSISIAADQKKVKAAASKEKQLDPKQGDFFDGQQKEKEGETD